MATTDHRHPGAAADEAARNISQYLRAEASGPDPLAPMTDGAIRDLQKALVERIADVDDDRRRGTILLQKAVNNHRAKTEERFSQLRLLLMVALGAWVLLLAGGLGALAWENARATQAIATRLAALEAQPADGATPPVADPAPLADLSARLEQLAGLTAALTRRVDEQGAGRPETTDLTAMVAPLLAPLQARQEALAAQLAAVETGDGGTAANAALRTEMTTALAALRTDLEARGKGAATTSAALSAELAPPKAGAADPAALRKEFNAGLEALRQDLAASTAETRETAVAAAEQAVGGQLAQATADAAAEAANAAAGAVRAALAERPRGAGPAGLSMDAMIDQQLTRLQREYQSLAQQAEAPALAPPPRAPEPQPEPESESESSLPPAPMPAADTPDPGAAATPASAATGSVVRVGDQGYAVQLIGFHTREELSAFLSGHELPAEVYVREEQLRGRPWYVLIHSLHRDLAGATAAQATLPASLAGLDVWIRSLPPDAELQILTVPSGANAVQP